MSRMRHMNANLVRTCDGQNLVQFASLRAARVAIESSVSRFFRSRSSRLDFAMISRPGSVERQITP